MRCSSERIVERSCCRPTWRSLPSPSTTSPRSSTPVSRACCASIRASAWTGSRSRVSRALPLTSAPVAPVARHRAFAYGCGASTTIARSARARSPKSRASTCPGPCSSYARGASRTPSASRGSNRRRSAAIEAAETLLRDLDAIDDRGLTTTGRSLATLPVPPRIGRLLVEAARLGCLERATLAAAILTERDPLRRGRDATTLRATTAYESDLLERVLLLERFAAAPPVVRKRGPSSTSARRRPCSASRAICKRRCVYAIRAGARVGRQPTNIFSVRCWPLSPIAWRGDESAAATVP